MFRSDITLEQLNQWSEGTLMQPLGIVFSEIGLDFLRGTMPVDGRTRQPYGLLHGGASVALAETLGSTAGGMCVGAAPIYPHNPSISRIARAAHLPTCAAVPRGSR